jgi:hypothetical protein
MLKLSKRKDSPNWYVRGTYCGVAIDASTKTPNKADAQRFKAELEIKIALSAGQKRGAATFQEAAALYVESKPQIAAHWLANINRLVSVIGDRMLANIRQHVLVEAGTPHLHRMTAGPHCWTWLMA